MKRPTDFFSVSDIKRNARKLPKGDVRYAIAEELLRLLWLKPSCKCRWQGTTTDLVELVYFIYSEGLLIDDKGFSALVPHSYGSVLWLVAGKDSCQSLCNCGQSTSKKGREAI